MRRAPYPSPSPYPSPRTLEVRRTAHPRGHVRRAAQPRTPPLTLTLPLALTLPLTLTETLTLTPTPDPNPEPQPLPLTPNPRPKPYPLTLPRCDVLPTLVPRLDIIINNACQTVRRPPQYYLPLIAAEVGGATPEDGPQVARLAVRGRGRTP